MYVAAMPYRVHVNIDWPPQSVHQSTLRGTDMQAGGRAAFKANMIKRLAKKPWIADHRLYLALGYWNSRTERLYMTVIPEFGVACRRLTPGPGYLEALCEDNVSISLLGTS